MSEPTSIKLLRDLDASIRSAEKKVVAVQKNIKSLQQTREWMVDVAVERGYLKPGQTDPDDYHRNASDHAEERVEP